MRVAVLADIHGNFDAFEAVVSDILAVAPDRVVCLGDNIGYGPEPDQVITLIRRLGFDSVLGNHEYALFDVRARRWLNFQAAENNEVVEGLLSRENLNFCRSLSFSLQLGEGYFVHGFPRDNVFLYLHRQNDERVAKMLDKQEGSLVFVGHTHRLQLVSYDGVNVSRRKLVRERVLLEPGKKYIINCGSVGQPRDGDNSAKYVVWDSEASTVEVRYVPYDVESTKAKMKKLGFPEVYALRLG